jgi:hypothetical protein
MEKADRRILNAFVICRLRLILKGAASGPLSAGT